MTDRGTLEIACREALQRIGKELRDIEPAGLGFALLVFDFGPGGNLAYVSNARREDMLRAMREFIEKNEAGGVGTVFDQGRKT